jgi:tetratricopeptide (TPR) repeat protein
MFKARREPPEREPAGRRPDRKALRQGTLERRCDFHLGEAIRASLTDSHDKAATHSGRALAISRELYAVAPKSARHRPGLAAALANHARYGGILRAITLLTESAGHYAALADADPETYEVLRIDVLSRVALAAELSGNTGDAIGLLREVIRMYEKAPAADPAQRDLSLAAAHFHLGRCLLKADVEVGPEVGPEGGPEGGAEAGGLAEIEAGLDLAEQAVELLRITGGEIPGWDGLTGDDPVGNPGGDSVGNPVGWLSRAPRPVQAVVPDWLAAATRAMTLHSAAGRWGQAARAARAAVQLSAGLAALGGDAQRQAHEALLARVNTIWERGNAVDCRRIGSNEANRTSCAVPAVYSSADPSASA